MFRKIVPIRSLFVSFIIMISYGLVYQFHNNEIIREYFEDRAFDNILNASIVSWLGLSGIGLANHAQKIENVPNTLIVSIDQNHLKQNHLIDDHNESAYGYLFPRAELSKLIESLDVKSEKLNLKAVFLDYDLSYTMMPNGQEWSEDDIQLLKTLQKKRNYKILIPIGSSHHVFYDHLQDASWIIPVSVSFANSADGISRRFVSEQDGFPSASLVLFSIAKGYEIAFDNKEIIINKQNYKTQDVIQNRIIVKNTYKHDGFYESKWLDLHIASASMLDNLEFDKKEIADGTFVLLGSGYQYSNDILKTSNSDLFGIEIHANALMTHFYLGGFLKAFPVLYAMILVFIVSFIINYGYDYLNGFSPTAGKEFIFSFAAVITMSIIMYVISYTILFTQKMWFNWNIPLMLFAISEMVDMILKLTTRYKYYKKGRTNK